MQNTLKVLSWIGKVAGLVAGCAAYANMIPAKYAGLGVIVFGLASILKDTVNRIGDFLDDGQYNQSFK